MDFSVTRNGKPLDPSLYTWDEKNKTFSTAASNLVLDFSSFAMITFNTGAFCTFKTGYGCEFTTDSYCTFTTGNTCNFKTGSDCTFKTGAFCTFKTGSSCTFTTSSDCTFTTGSKCVIIRRDIFEIGHPEENTTVKLNKHNVPGYTVIDHIISIDGKEIKLSHDSFNELKK